MEMLFLKRFYDICKQHHLKITPQRVAVYEAVSDSAIHPSADLIHKRVRETFPNISLDTVNRTLLTFADVGIIDIVEGQGDARRFDPNLDEHHHLYCLGCNTIVDFYDETLNQIKISKAIKEKYTIVSKRVYLKGFCENCSKQA